MNRILLFVTIFSFGYMFNDVLKEFDLKLINEVSADVAGMDRYDLKRDYDFKRAVEDIVEDNVTRYSIESIVEDIVEDCDVSGYIDDDYLYGASISC